MPLSSNKETRERFINETGRTCPVLLTRKPGAGQYMSHISNKNITVRDNIRPGFLIEKTRSRQFFFFFFLFHPVSLSRIFVYHSTSVTRFALKKTKKKKLKKSSSGAIK